MSWPVPAISAVVLDANGKVLLQREGDGWCLPGGKLPGGKTWLEAVASSVEAFTGEAPATPQLVGLYTSEPESRVVVGFRIMEFSGTPDGAEWFSTQALPHELPAGDRVRVTDAAQFRGEVFLR